MKQNFGCFVYRSTDMGGRSVLSSLWPPLLTEIVANHPSTATKRKYKANLSKLGRLRHSKNNFFIIQTIKLFCKIEMLSKFAQSDISRCKIINVNYVDIYLTFRYAHIFYPPNGNLTSIRGNRFTDIQPYFR